MEFLNYFLISILCYLGVISGYIIMWVASEEKEEGMKYFIPFQGFLFVAFVLLTVFFKFDNLFFIIGGVLALIVFFLFRKFQIYFSYLFFSLFFYLFSQYVELSILSVIIFMYGLVAGAIIFDLKGKKSSLMKVVSLFYFVVIANILYLVF